MNETDYTLLLAQAKSLTEDVPHFIANLANIAALIYNTLPDINWAGFYLAEENELILSGPPRLRRHPLGQGRLRDRRGQG